MKNFNEFRIPYSIIKEIYDKFAIHRIKLEYLLCNENSQRKNELEKCIQLYCYLNHFIEKGKFREDIIRNMNDDLRNYYSKYLQELNGINLENLEKFLKQIIEKTDSHLDCEYHVTMDFDNFSLIPNKIVNKFAIYFNDKINSENYSVCDKTSLLDCNFIRIFGKERKTTFFLHFDKEMCENGFIKILDLPPKYRYLYSVIKE